MTSQEAVNMYESGASAREVANAADVNVASVYRWLRRHGARPRRILKERALPARIEQDASRIIKRWDDGASSLQLSEEFGYSRGVIKRVLARAGRKMEHRPAAGARHPRWSGGRCVTSDGYIEVAISRDDPLAGMGRIKGGSRVAYVREHRLVMARALGRPLTSDETVHHKDGNRENNALENLQLRHGQHGQGAIACCGDCGSRNIIHKEI